MVKPHNGMSVKEIKTVIKRCLVKQMGEWNSPYCAMCLLEKDCWPNPRKGESRGRSKQ